MQLVAQEIRSEKRHRMAVDIELALHWHELSIEWLELLALDKMPVVFPMKIKHYRAYPTCQCVINVWTHVLLVAQEIRQMAQR